MADDLFDLEDYENEPDQPQETIKEKVIEQKQLQSIQQNTTDKPKEEAKGITQLPLQEPQEPLKSTITSLPKVKAKTYAIKDSIDIAEYNKIPQLALKTPFELDDFQKRGIIRVERHENVLVCAHTSSGKTLVAEYAIAKSALNKKRIIYTSPIKALSNQKYRDFKEHFDDVGIVTGDVSINPEGQCIIMTTEILQNLLYKNSEKLKYVDYVVFDEVHYINDKERGHVWEEILILLPQSIGIVMLSATIPNYFEFAQWIGSIKSTEIYIEITYKRVVPLEHKVYINGKNIFVIKSADDKVNEENIIKALNKASEENERVQVARSKAGNKKEKKEREEKLFHQIKQYNQFMLKRQADDYNDKSKEYNRITLTHLKIEELVSYVNKEKLTPVVVFVFSIKKIDEYARMLSKNNYADPAESHRILRFFDKCIGKLSDCDKKIGQVQSMRMLLPSGVGVHHAGLLPILKEIVEILYSKGLIKILFATTSFSIGLNMPTKTVAFTEVTKFNEGNREILSSSEYLQMCGRAGRRGIDDKGNIFILMGDRKYQVSATEMTRMVRGEGTVVESKFRLSYKTIINFFYRNVKNIVEFFKESYIESNTFMSIPQVIKDIDQSKEKLAKMKPIDCVNDIETIGEFYTLKRKIGDIRSKLLMDQRMAALIKSKGRVIIYNSKKQLKDIYVLVVNYYPDYNGEIWCLNVTNDKKAIADYEIDPKKKPNAMEKGVVNGKLFTYFTIYAPDIVDICDYTMKSCGIAQFDQDNNGFDYFKKKDLELILNELLDCNLKKDTEKDALKVVDYMKVGKNDINIHMILEDKKAVTSQMISNKCYACPLQNQHLMQYEEIKQVRDALERNEAKLKEENLRCFKEFQARLNVLKKLEYVDEDNQLLLKGKASKEISSNDSLFITELLLSNVIDKLPVEELIAFLAGFVGNQNVVDFTDPEISKEFTQAIKDFKEVHDRIDAIEKAESFQESGYNRRVSFGLSRTIQLWMLKKPFSEILDETDLEEGKVYTVINRLTLFLDSIIDLYEVLGNKTLGEKYVKAKEILLRDILTCRSLYLEEDLDIKDL